MLIFLDLETTGLEDIDKVCSIGIITQDSGSLKCYYEIVNEGKKVSPKASSINHITNEMLQGKLTLKETEIFKVLQANNKQHNTIIGHNISFMMQKLSQVGFSFNGLIIDTQRVAKHLVQGCESYALQFLRYELKLYKQEQKALDECSIKEKMEAHHALYDALLVKLLYDYLLDIQTHEKMCELSFEHVLLEKFEFGKYNGRYIEEIAGIDNAYLQWLHSTLSVDDESDLKYTLEYYLYN